MQFKDVLKQTREAKGLTQQELAEQLYVTRQAVSRWENGETEPGIDMRKLIANALGVPVIELLGIQLEDLCQCCGTPFTVPNMPRGTNKNGSENTDYCKWCFVDGEFAYTDEETLIETIAPFVREAMGITQDEAVSFMGELVPHLKHWK